MTDICQALCRLSALYFCWSPPFQSERAESWWTGQPDLGNHNLWAQALEAFHTDIASLCISSLTSVPKYLKRKCVWGHSFFFFFFTVCPIFPAQVFWARCERARGKVPFLGVFNSICMHFHAREMLHVYEIRLPWYLGNTGGSKCPRCSDCTMFDWMNDLQDLRLLDTFSPSGVCWSPCLVWVFVSV